MQVILHFWKCTVRSDASACGAAELCHACVAHRCQHTTFCLLNLAARLTRGASSVAMRLPACFQQVVSDQETCSCCGSSRHQQERPLPAGCLPRTFLSGQGASKAHAAGEQAQEAARQHAAAASGPHWALCLVLPCCTLYKDTSVCGRVTGLPQMHGKAPGRGCAGGAKDLAVAKPLD